MRIAVTGGSGFIGAATVEYANENGHEAWSFDRSTGNDITKELDGLKGAEAVIHLAGVLGTHELFDHIQDAIDINVSGAYRVMQWCIDNNAQYTGITMPDAFPSIYTATKIASQRIATALHHSKGLYCSHVRAFNAYGPGQKYGPGHPQKIVPTFIMAALRGQPIPIWGDGQQGVDLVYVDDIARILVEATHYNDNHIYDAGSGFCVTVNDLATAIEELCGARYSRLHLPMRKGEIPTQIRASGEGWERVRPPAAPNQDLMIDTINWYRENAL